MAARSRPTAPTTTSATERKAPVARPASHPPGVPAPCQPHLHRLCNHMQRHRYGFGTLTDHKMMNEVDDLCLKFAGVLAAIRQQEMTLAVHRENAYEECRKALAPFLQSITKDHGDEWFQFLSWELPHELPTALASLFGRHRNTYKLRPVGSGINCSECSKELMVTYQHELEIIQREAAPLCATCRAIKNGDHSEELRREREAHLQRQRDLRKMPYLDYLQTPEWRMRRKGAFRRARYRCQLCNIGGVRLNAHHRTYENKGQELPEDLTVLCEECHKQHHSNRHSATDRRV